jgi:hypothetical protein
VTDRTDTVVLERVMTAGPLPDDVLGLLRDRVSSLEELETLRLLHVGRQEWWNGEAVGARLKIPPASADEALEQLHRQGLLVSRVQSGITLYKYEGVEAALDATVGRLIHAYDDERISVMKVLSSNAVERVRSSVIRTFADAFVVGRKKDG